MEFRGKVNLTGLFYRNPAEFLEWLAKHHGLWFVMTIKILGGKRDRKTKEQLGYYWGLLLPEIHDQYIREGYTITVLVNKVRKNGKSLTVEREPTLGDSHELVKDICGYIGNQGERLDMRDMDKFQVVKFIDNVLFHATKDLEMNGKALESHRPELSQEIIDNKEKHKFDF
jgi:hypothetical protein